MAHYKDNPIPATLVWEILGLARPSLEQQLNQDLPQSLLLEKYNDHELTIDYLGRDPDDPSLGIYRVVLGGGLVDILISDGI